MDKTIAQAMVLGGTAVVMHAPSSQQSFPAADKESLVWTCNLADAKGYFDRVIISGRYLCGVEVWRRIAPQFCIGNRKLYARTFSGNAVYVCFHFDRSLDPDDRRVCAYRTDP